MSKRAVILLSGGMDSATALYWALREKYDLTAISVNFFQRSPLEREAVRYLVQQTGIHLMELDLPFVKEASNLFWEDKVPLPYGDKYPEGYIPQRNLVFYAIASYFAEIYGIEYVIGGHLDSDPKLFPDSSKEFFTRLEQLINIGIPQKALKVQFLMPFAGFSKTQVAKLALELGVPLDHTWSCYWEGPKPCLDCHPCKDRIHAFSELGKKDPLLQFHQL